MPSQHITNPSVPLPTSSTDQLPPAIGIPRQLVRNQADRHEPVELANMVAHTDIIPSHPSTLRHDVDAQTHSHVHSHRSTVRRDVDVQTTPSVPSVRTPHTSPAPRADVPATAPSTSRGRGVIDRVLVQPKATPAAVSAPTLPRTLDMSDTPPLGFITDVPNNAPRSEARVPFPEWFQKRVRTLLDELKDDLRTTGQSRHYKAGQFWIRANSVWSSLKGTTLKPTDLFTPDFFLWDPLNLLGKSHTLRCPMPNCNHHLTRGGVVNRPRRVVDVDSTFWLIGYTYECQKTATGGCDARTHLLSKLPSHGASVPHMVACLLDFVLCHNLRELEITLGEHYNCLPAQLAWVNGNLYRKTEQTAGIIQIPKSVRELVKIQQTDTKQNQAYLAKMQGTRKPVLSVHTLAEKQLFSELMQTSPTFQKCSTSISLAAAEIWNQKAENTDDVYYSWGQSKSASFIAQEPAIFG
ncbi:hypothetical protein B0H11DRAFT_2384785 [Mycena galericulata]|nr:hypothetical protein B0H11DRAFT_2384785 [Mycena galericulata]